MHETWNVTNLGLQVVGILEMPGFSPLAICWKREILMRGLRGLIYGLVSNQLTIVWSSIPRLPSRQCVVKVPSGHTTVGAMSLDLDPGGNWLEINREGNVDICLAEDECWTSSTVSLSRAYCRLDRRPDCHSWCHIFRSRDLLTILVFTSR